MIISSETILENFTSLKPHLICSNGGDLAVEKYLEDGTTSTVSGSPVLDGEELYINTKTYGQKLKLTPSASNTHIEVNKL